MKFWFGVILVGIGLFLSKAAELPFTELTFAALLLGGIILIAAQSLR